MFSALQHQQYQWHVHQPGIEPGSHRWQRCILPLDHWCHWLWEQVDFKFTAGNCACVQTPWLTLSRVQASCLTPSTSQARGYFTVSQVPMATPLQKWCSLPVPSSSTPVPKYLNLDCRGHNATSWPLDDVGHASLPWTAALPDKPSPVTPLWHLLPPAFFATT